MVVNYKFQNQSWGKIFGENSMFCSVNTFLHSKLNSSRLVKIPSLLTNDTDANIAGGGWLYDSFLVNALAHRRNSGRSGVLSLVGQVTL